MKPGFCALLGDLRPLDTAIMNASVSIDRVIWSIVTGPFSTALIFYTSCNHNWSLQMYGAAPSQHALYYCPANHTARRSIHQTNASFCSSQRSVPGRTPAVRSDSSSNGGWSSHGSLPFAQLYSLTPLCLQNTAWANKLTARCRGLTMPCRRSVCARTVSPLVIDVVTEHGAVPGPTKPAAPHASVRELESPHLCSGSRSSLSSSA